MADFPTLQTGRRISQPLDAVSYGSNGGQSLQNPFESISMALRNASAHIETRLDLQAKIEGAKAGTLAGQDGIPNLQDEMTLRGSAFNMAARDAVQTQFELNGITNLNDYEKAHEADPAGFRQKSDGYWSGIEAKLKEFDPAIAQKIGADYKIRATNALGRIEDRARAIARDQQLESVLKLQMSLQDSLENNAAQLFDPATSPDKRVELLNQMISSGQRISETSHNMGADGRFLFSASERVRLQRGAESAVSGTIGTAWLNSQKDMIGAYSAWQKGEASIDLPDGAGGSKPVALKELLGASGYKMAQDQFFDTLKSSLALQAQVDAASERAFTKQSDSLFVELSTRAQDGGIALKDVDAAKNMMKPDDYLALRSMAKAGGATVSDGATLSGFIVRDAAGEDITAELVKAHDSGKLSTDDFRKYYVQNKTRAGADIHSPVNAARDSLSKRLGAMSKDLGIAQSGAIGQANFEFEARMSEFRQVNGRDPSYDEADKISNEVFRRFSAVDVDTAVYGLPLPASVSQAEKLNTRIGSAFYAQKIKDLQSRKLSEYGGDKTKLASDPDYLNEIMLLKQYHDILKLKEDGNARADSNSK